MSDFLSRVAARAVGRAPAARPRLPALFDPSPGAGAELELAGEGTPERTAVPAPPPDPRRRTSLAAAGAEPTDPGSPVERRPAPAATPAAATQDADLPDATAKRPPSAAELRTPGDPEEHDRAVGPPPEREPVALVPAPPSAAEPVPAQAAVAAEPASPAALEAASHGDASSPATPVDPSPSMRVHIGRLDVRANLQPAAPMPSAAPERHRPDQPRSVSLTDYLRGKREAG